jgi:glycosyl-4,4'-diaponeurosporenoate acyltransferase
MKMSLPLLQLSDELIVCFSVLGWTVWSFFIGFVGNRLPLQFLETDTWLTQPHSCYDDRQWYEQVLRIKSWKDRLPEAGNFFPGGFRKDSIGAGSYTVMYRFLAETRRAEYVHIGIWLFWLLSMFWTPGWGVLVNLFVGTAFNLPCLWVQRYNRLRLHHLLRLKTKEKTD